MKVSQTTYAFTTTLIWDSINWKTIVKAVEVMQHRIVQAIKKRKFRKAKSLQRILTNFFYAKLLAVRRVTLNKGKNTPGVDGVRWTTSKQKMNAVLNLRSIGYKAKPMRRVFIPKSNGIASTQTLVSLPAKTKSGSITVIVEVIAFVQPLASV